MIHFFPLPQILEGFWGFCFCSPFPRLSLWGQHYGFHS